MWQESWLIGVLSLSMHFGQDTSVGAKENGGFFFFFFSQWKNDGVVKTTLEDLSIASEYNDASDFVSCVGMLRP